MIEAISTLIATRYLPPPRTRAAIDRLQAHGFARLRRTIMPRSPFYAPFADQPLDRWPQMNKARLMEHFSHINTAGLTRAEALDLTLQAEASRDFTPMIGDVALGLSTGTSGQRGLFASNRAERRLWAALMVGRFMPQLWRRQRVAFFLRANNPLYETVRNPLIAFGFYDLLRGIDAHIPALNHQNPSVLIAPAQVLTRLAGAQTAGHLRIAPQQVISVAEVLSPEDEIAITRAFDRPVAQIYQCTEGVLALTCKAGALHLNESYVHFGRDVVDAATGAFCPIITDLRRQTLPILNYRLDDVLVPDPTPCACGSAATRIARIEGRADDMVYWHTRNSGTAGTETGLIYVPADILRQAVATATASIDDYRMHQIRQDTLHITLDTPAFDAACASVQANLLRAAATLGAQLPPLTFSQGIAPQARGGDPAPKRRRVTVER